jgi:hypothetical protein
MGEWEWAGGTILAGFFLWLGKKILDYDERKTKEREDKCNSVSS